MSEPKYAYRIPPCPDYDIEGMESWLEDMAAKGYILEKDGFFAGLVTFVKTTPKKMKYRLEATATNGGLFSSEHEPEADAIQMNQDMGWEYVARRGQFHIYASTDPNAPELNTDPQVQALTLKALSKYLRRSLIQTVVTFAILYLMHYSNVTVTGAIVLGSWRVALLIGLAAFGFLREINRFLTILRLRRQLQRGLALSHRSDYQKRGYRHIISSTANTVLWIILFVSTIGVIATASDKQPLGAHAGDFPFHTLSDLYPEAQIEHKNAILYSEYTQWSDPIAPVNYDFTEFADVTHPDGTTDSCYLTLNYHELRWEWTARMLAREFPSQKGANPLMQTLSRLTGKDPVEVHPLTGVDADYAVYCTNKYRTATYIVLQKGRTVIQVSLDCIGDDLRFDLSELARLYAEALK